MPETPGGTAWTQREIDLVVADYFAMRARFLRGETFVKADHYHALMSRLGRTRTSIERKYMNISATLECLGMPWLTGYAPLRNFQAALLQSVEKYVEREWFNEPDPTWHEPDRMQLDSSSIHEPPVRARFAKPDNPEVERLIRKFDAAHRDALNRNLGAAGEECVLKYEITRLKSVDRADLARKVRWVAKEDGDGAGYDIRSYTCRGATRFLEVKTTMGHSRTPFYLTRNERDLAAERADEFRIFRLYDWGTHLGAFIIRPPLESALVLEPSVYKASFG